MSNIIDIKLTPHQCYLGKEGLKADGVKLPWSLDMLAELDKCESDPVYFMETYVLTSVADGGDLVPFRPFEYQKKVIQSYIDNRFTISMAPRQHGKCFCLNTIVRIRHKTTGEIRELPIGDFYKMQKDNRDNK